MREINHLRRFLSNSALRVPHFALNAAYSDIFRHTPTNWACETCVTQPDGVSPSTGSVAPASWTAAVFRRFRRHQNHSKRHKPFRTGTWRTQNTSRRLPAFGLPAPSAPGLAPTLKCQRTHPLTAHRLRLTARASLLHPVTLPHPPLKFKCLDPVLKCMHASYRANSLISTVASARCKGDGGCIGAVLTASAKPVSR
jgi:hypothetical protein